MFPTHEPISLHAALKKALAIKGPKEQVEGVGRERNQKKGKGKDFIGRGKEEIFFFLELASAWGEKRREEARRKEGKQFSFLFS